MKIIEARYNNGEAQFKIDERPGEIFCVKLEGKKTIEEVTDELKTMIPPAPSTEQIFNSLALKTLEGTEL